MKVQDEYFMHLALLEARKGMGRTSPNPCVGAVVVRDGAIVASGWHRRAGADHAEVDALKKAGELARGATLYVTLEPCNHSGRTPPCTRAVVEAGIARVVTGMLDPNPRVAGGGNDYLRSCGIEVASGILEGECAAVNRPFIKHSGTGLPWVVMKAGMSLDGRISYQPGRGGRITGEEARLYTHRLRNTNDAILIGIGTALIDNPSLTCRLPDEERGRDPLRIIIDSRLRLPSSAAVFNRQSSAPVRIFCAADASGERERELTGAGAVVYRTGSGSDGRLDMGEILVHLGRSGITSVLVEGGAAIHGNFLSREMVDEIYLFVAPFFIGSSGTPLIEEFSCAGPDSCPRLDMLQITTLGKDALWHGIMPGKSL
jgi:diaminohydroxyphosphoribosylaminopyrimidine deaminase / 5-amino-6-(5-phosphoribosylamino)uracil reductase